VLRLPLDFASPSVGVGHNATEVFGEDSLAVGFNFAEGNDSVAFVSGCEGEPSDSAEEIEVGWYTVCLLGARCFFMVHGARY
jgi:hypothetical protein